MAKFSTKEAREFYAQTYDVVVSDWEDEIDFYRDFASRAASNGASILEIACGTGRVALRLVDCGTKVVGLDSSPAMLEVARSKAEGVANMEWVESDMRSFDLGEKFGLVIIPGHSFQNLLGASDQVACLRCIASNMDDDGILVIHLDHQSMAWLGKLVTVEEAVFKDAESFIHPETGRQIQTSRAWSYEPSTQTATSETVWREVDVEGNCINRWESGPLKFHCVFRFEMEHLLSLTGFQVEALYGSFSREELTDESESMIWVAKKLRG